MYSLDGRLNKEKYIKTSPSLNIQIGNDIYYGNMTVDDVVLTRGSSNNLKLRYGNKLYSVYDDSVDISN